MKVTGTGSSSATGQGRRADRSGRRTGEFARHLGAVDGVAEQSPMDALNPLAAVDALLAAQCVTDATDGEARRTLVRHGDDILDRLEEIRLGLLAGGLSRQRLIALASLVRNRRDAVADPRLAAILDEIDLRAQVELAKYGRAG